MVNEYNGNLSYIAVTASSSKTFKSMKALKNTWPNSITQNSKKQIISKTMETSTPIKPTLLEMEIGAKVAFPKDRRKSVRTNGLRH